MKLFIRGPIGTSSRTVAGLVGFVNIRCCARCVRNIVEITKSRRFSSSLSTKPKKNHGCSSQEKGCSRLGFTSLIKSTRSGSQSIGRHGISFSFLFFYKTSQIDTRNLIDSTDDRTVVQLEHKRPVPSTKKMKKANPCWSCLRIQVVCLLSLVTDVVCLLS